MPIHQSDIKEHLEFQLTFNDRNKIVKASGDTDAKYAISEVNLEYEVVSNSNLARTITNLHKGKTVMLFDEIVNYTTKSLNKQDDKWDIKLSVSARSLKGILLLFVDPADGGAPFDRDSEKFYNPQIEDVAIAIGGKRNQLYDSGMKRPHHWNEICKHFSDGNHRTNQHVAKEFKLTDMSLPDYLTDKYGLWLDMRSTDDGSLYGTGRNTVGTNNEIQILIKREAEAAGTLDCYIYYIRDTQLNFENGRYIGTTS
jgi:hypothetical protein